MSKRPRARRENGPARIVGPALVPQMPLAHGLGIGIVCRFRPYAPGLRKVLCLGNSSIFPLGPTPLASFFESNSGHF